MTSHPLTSLQIKQLTQQDCTAENWKTVTAPEGCDFSRIRNARFSGTVNLGNNSGSLDYHGIKLPCGIYDATLSDCSLGENVRIARVHTGISRYQIEDEVLIQDIGLLAAEPETTFGCGVEIDVLNEAGGRGTIIFGTLSAQVAYLNALFRHNRTFVEQITSLARQEVQATTPQRGIVGRGSQVVGCGKLLNLVVGPFARLEGALHLENGTIRSCQEDPTLLGTGVQAKNFVVAEGARIESGALLDRAFVGQGVRMGKQFSAENSLFFANSEAFHGEGVALFAGPYTVTHHKSTLLIAALFSFYNAGSGTNQSNHMYKLGPVHQGIFERGCKTGSFSYVLFESHVGAFSVVIGKHFSNIDTANFPFSYIAENGGESMLIPGQNLLSIGTVRDGEKWPKRDNRKVHEKRDLIIFDVFSPYTVERMRRGRDELLLLNRIAPKERPSVPIGGIQSSRALLRKGGKYYQSAVTRYLLDRVFSRLESALSPGTAWSEAIDTLHPTTALKNASEWTDLCGLLAPLEVVRDLEITVAKGSMPSYGFLLEALRKMFDNYRVWEWQYVVETFEAETGSPLSALSEEHCLMLVEDWRRASLALGNSVLADSKKEFGAGAHIGYGLGLPESDVDADFAAVRGTIDSNSVVQKLAGENQEIDRRATALRARIREAH